MSFDVYYHTCNLGSRTAQRKNPLTGKVQTVPVDDGLTAAERSAVVDLLRSSGASKPGELSCYVLDLPDGGSAEVFASGLEGPQQCDGLMVSLGSMTPELARFLWELCRAGNVAAMPIMEEEVVVVASDCQLRRVQERWPQVVVVSSSEGFGRLLSGGLAAWKAYRDQVVDTRLD